jgi:hypothetical protein
MLTVFPNLFKISEKNPNLGIWVMYPICLGSLKCVFHHKTCLYIFMKLSYTVHLQTTDTLYKFHILYPPNIKEPRLTYTLFQIIRRSKTTNTGTSISTWYICTFTTTTNLWVIYAFIKIWNKDTQKLIKEQS